MLLERMISVFLLGLACTNRLCMKCRSHATFFLCSDLCNTTYAACAADLARLGQSSLLSCTSSDASGDPLYPEAATIYDLSAIGLPDEIVGCTNESFSVNASEPQCAKPVFEKLGTLSFVAFRCYVLRDKLRINAFFRAGRIVAKGRSARYQCSAVGTHPNPQYSYAI